MSKENLFAYVHWADGYASVINIANIKVPRKEILEYVIGDKIKAPFPGYPGEHDATIIQISDNKMLLANECKRYLLASTANEVEEVADVNGYLEIEESQRKKRKAALPKKITAIGGEMKKISMNKATDKLSSKKDDKQKKRKQEEVRAAAALTYARQLFGSSDRPYDNVNLQPQSAGFNLQPQSASSYLQSVHCSPPQSSCSFSPLQSVGFTSQPCNSGPSPQFASCNGATSRSATVSVAPQHSSFNQLQKSYSFSLPPRSTTVSLPSQCTSFSSPAQDTIIRSPPQSTFTTFTTPLHHTTSIQPSQTTTLNTPPLSSSWHSTLQSPSLIRPTQSSSVLPTPTPTQTSYSSDNLYQCLTSSTLCAYGYDLDPNGGSVLSSNNSGEFMSMLTNCEPCAQCEQKSTAIAMLQREVIELRSKVDRMNSEAAKTSDCGVEVYKPKRGMIIPKGCYKVLAQDELLPPLFTLLVDGHPLAVEVSWLTSVVAKCRGKPASFLIKKMLQGLMTPWQMAINGGSRAYEGPLSAIVEAVKVYGANVLKMTAAEATRAVNEANASARRILKSLETAAN